MFRKVFDDRWLLSLALFSCTCSGLFGDRIVFLGDSLTAGYLLEPELAFPQLMGDALADKGHEVQVVNAGVSGDTSAGGKRRINWLLKRPLDVLVLGLGGNDALRGIDPISTKKNIKYIIEKVQQNYPDADILLLGMLAPPNMGESYASEFNAIYPFLAEELDVSIYPFLLDGVAGEPELNLEDGIHPNIEGHATIAQKLLPYLEAIIIGADASEGALSAGVPEADRPVNTFSSKK